MKFFVLENPEVGSPFDTDFLSAEPIIDGEPMKCPVCGGYVGKVPWLPPHRAELEIWGQDYGDVVYGPGANLLVSEKFKELWSKSGLSGLTGFWPVEIVRVKRRKKQKLRTRPLNYYCVAIAHSRAAIDYAASGIEFEGGPAHDICPECNKSKKLVKRGHRLVFKLSTWSGEDIFFPRGLPAEFCTTARFKDFVTDNAIKNVVLVPAEKYAFGFQPWDLQKN